MPKFKEVRVIAKTKPKAKRGKFHYWLTEDGQTLLEGWARDGLTDVQIAKNLGIVPSTLYIWKNKYLEISEALKKGKEVVDFEVENALLKKALGYEYEETRTETGGNDSEKLITTKKHAAGDTTAMIFFLKNRRPDKWRAKPKNDADDNGMLESLIRGIINHE